MLAGDKDKGRGEMKEHQLLMTGPNIVLIDKGLKTQTRRVITRHNSTIDGGPASKKRWDSLDFERAWPVLFEAEGGPYLEVWSHEGTVHRIRCKWRKGDVFWIKETWADNIPGCPNRITYRADHLDPKGDGPANPIKWNSSLFMPRKYARKFLKLLKDPGPERLRDISTEDCIAEGMRSKLREHDACCELEDKYKAVWDGINGNTPGKRWADNPWLWPLPFKPVPNYKGLGK